MPRLGSVTATRARRCTRVLHLGIVAATVACNDVQPTDPFGRIGPRGDSDGPARFALSARLDRDTTEPIGARWDIFATMHPGYEDGAVREAVDTLWLDGLPHLPDLEDRGYRRYHAVLESTLDGVHANVVTVEPPAVEGIAQVPTLEFAGIGRPGGDTIQWTPGSDFVFQLAVPATLPTPGSVRGSWSLSVTQDSTTLSLHGSGLPPDSLVFPDRYFSAAGSQVQVRFSYWFEGYQTPDDAQGYALNYSVSGHFTWLVSVTDAGT